MRQDNVKIMRWRHFGANRNKLKYKHRQRQWAFDRLPVLFEALSSLGHHGKGPLPAVFDHQVMGATANGLPSDEIVGAQFLVNVLTSRRILNLPASDAMSCCHLEALGRTGTDGILQLSAKLFHLTGKMAPLQVTFTRLCTVSLSSGFAHLHFPRQAALMRLGRAQISSWSLPHFLASFRPS